MPSAPSLTDDQWNQIYDIVPAKKRNRQMISAIVYRHLRGGSTYATARLFDVPVVQLQTWEGHLVKTRRLRAIIQALGLPEPSNGGQRSAWDNPATREELAVYKQIA